MNEPSLTTLTLGALEARARSLASDQLRVKEYRSAIAVRENLEAVEEEIRVRGGERSLDEGLVCRTMGSNLHMTRGEMLALLGHLQEPDGGAVIRRRLEVLLGEKTLGQVDDEAEQERQRRIFPAADASTIDTE